MAQPTRKHVQDKLNALSDKEWYPNLAEDEFLIWRASEHNSDVGVGYDWEEESWVFVDTAGYTSPEKSLEAAIKHLYWWLNEGRKERGESPLKMKRNADKGMFDDMLDDVRDYTLEDLEQGSSETIDYVLWAIEEALSIYAKESGDNKARNAVKEVKAFKGKIKRTLY